MPKQKTKDVKIESIQEVETTEVITTILLKPDTRIYWEIKTYYNDVVTGIECFNYDYTDVIGMVNGTDLPSGFEIDEQWDTETLYEEILFYLADEIRAMPEGKEKRKFKNHGIKLTIN